MPRPPERRRSLIIFKSMTRVSLCALGMLVACGEFGLNRMPTGEGNPTPVDTPESECAAAHVALNEEHVQIMDDINGRKDAALAPIEAALEDLTVQTDAISDGDEDSDERRAAMDRIRAERTALKQQRTELQNEFGAERQAQTDRLAAEQEALQAECEGVDYGGAENAEECATGHKGLSEEHKQIMADIDARKDAALAPIEAGLDDLAVQAETVADSQLGRDKRRAAMDEIRAERVALKQQRTDLQNEFGAERQAQNEHYAAQREAFQAQCQGVVHDAAQSEDGTTGG